MDETNKDIEPTSYDAEYFANRVKEYSVYGMVPKNTQIGSITINPDGNNNLGTRGTDGVLFWDAFKPNESLTRKFFALIKSSMSDRRQEFSELTRKTHYVAVLDPTQDVSANSYKVYPENTAIFAYGFLYDPEDQDPRGLSLGVTGALMEKDDAQKLAEEIKKNPQLLEDFYQKVFSGLDSKIDQHTGMKRLKADGFVVLNKESLEMVPEISSYATNVFPLNVVESLPKYKFSDPVGVK